MSVGGYPRAFEKIHRDIPNLSQKIFVERILFLISSTRLFEISISEERKYNVVQIYFDA